MPPQLFELAAQPAPEIVKAIRRGVPAAAFALVAAAVRLPRATLARKLGLAQRTINRKAKDRARLSAEESEKLMRVARVHNLAKRIFTDDDAIAQWLVNPAPGLRSVAPIDLLDTDVGAREVEALLHGIAHGNFI